DPRQLIKLGTPDAGIIESVKVDRGDLVHAGDIVATLDPELQRLALRTAKIKAANEVDIKSERARLGYRKQAAERNETLHRKDFVATKSYDEAMVELQLAELAVQKADNEHRMAVEELAQAQARLERRSVRSPVTGVIADVTIRTGEYAYDQTPLMTIAEI